MSLAPTFTLRGEGPFTLHMEELQKSYIHGIAAAAGCTVVEPRVDANKVDLTIEHKSIAHTQDRVATVRLQLKSTHTLEDNGNGAILGETFSYSLPNDTLEMLASRPFIIQRLLVVMILPEKPEEWTIAGTDHLVLRNRCYWVNLLDVPTSGSKTTTIYVPWANVLDAHALCDIMEAIGRGDEPR